MNISTNTKKTIRYFLIALIVLVSLSVILFPNFFFARVDVMQYSDGCNETYVNGKLNSTPCYLHNYSELKQAKKNQAIIDSVNYSLPSTTK